MEYEALMNGKYRLHDIDKKVVVFESREVEFVSEETAKLVLSMVKASYTEGALDALKSQVPK